MSRALEYRAATALLKKSFSAKGVSLAHTEALDLFAKLQGFEAWSHLKGSQPKKRVSKQVPVGKSFGELWCERYPASHSFETFPKEDWKYQVDNEDTHLGYLDWVEQQLAMHHDLSMAGTRFVARPLSVTDLEGNPTQWNFETDLTDRWGDVNTNLLERKPSLPFLVLDDTLLTRLRDAMFEEDSFIASKDGQYGILVEVEYCTRESDGDTNLLPYEEVKQLLLEGMRRLASQHPQVAFAVPDPVMVYNGRAAAWAFMPVQVAETFSQAQRVEFVVAMARLDSGLACEGTTTGRTSSERENGSNVPKAG